MYLDHFGLVADPFSLSPRLDFLYISDAFEESMAHLAYGLENGETITLITGVIGTGKTLAVHSFLTHLDSSYATALVNTTQVGYRELLKLILVDLGASYPEQADRADLLAALKSLVDQASSERRKILVVIDEAQNLSPESLEGLRMLTNLGQMQGQALQLILVGQPDLERMINQPELAQLRQRIRVHYQLQNLNRQELTEYINHRLQVAGCERELFHAAALERIYELSKGIPRLVNVIAGESLLAAYLADSPTVKVKHVESESATPTPSQPEAPRPAERKRAVERVVERAVEEKLSERQPPIIATVTAEAPVGVPDEREVAAAGMAPGIGHDEVWIPTMARRSRRPGFGLTVALVVVAMLVLVALGWYFLWPQQQGQPLTGRQTPSDMVATPSAIARNPSPSPATADDTAEPVDTGVAASPTDSPATTPAREPDTAGTEASQPPPASTGSSTPARDDVARRSVPTGDPQIESGRDESAAAGAPTPAMASAGTATEPAANSAAVQPPARGYAVHVSSFREADRAFQLCGDLRSDGLLAFCRQVTIRGQLWHRVFLGPYSETPAANHAINQLRKDGWDSYFQIMKLRDVQ